MAYTSPLSAYLTSPIVDTRTSKGPGKWRKKLAILGISALFPVLGTSFASSITTGAGPIEFGQGSTALVVCDSSITVDVQSSWDSSLSYFKLTGFTLGDVDTNSAHCLGKTLKITAFNASGTAIDLNGTAAGNSIDYTVIAPEEAAASRDVTVGSFETPVNVDSTSISQVTIQTS